MNIPKLPVVTTRGSDRVLPVTVIRALRMPAPSAVVTRPEIEAPAAVGGSMVRHQPPEIDPFRTSGLSGLPPSSRTYRLHVPFGFVSPNVPNIVLPIGRTGELPGSTYGAGG